MDEEGMVASQIIDSSGLKKEGGGSGLVPGRRMQVIKTGHHSHLALLG